MMDLSHRLVMPKPHQSDPHAYQAGGYVHITQLSTDAFAAYPEAVDLAFGPYAKFGTIKKDYRNAAQPGRYAPPEMVGTERKGIPNGTSVHSVMPTIKALPNWKSRTFTGSFPRTRRKRARRINRPWCGWSFCLCRRVCPLVASIDRHCSALA